MCVCVCVCVLAGGGGGGVVMLGIDVSGFVQFDFVILEFVSLGQYQDLNLGVLIPHFFSKRRGRGRGMRSTYELLILLWSL